MFKTKLNYMHFKHEKLKQNSIQIKRKSNYEFMLLQNQICQICRLGSILVIVIHAMIKPK